MNSDPGLGERKTKDTGKIEQAFRAFEKDPTFYRIIARSLGAAIILSVLGIVVLEWCGEEVPQGLVAVASGAVGAFASVLTVGRRT